MVNKMLVQFICLQMVVMFVNLSSNSFAADENKTLSKAMAQVKLFTGLTEPERDTLETVAMLRSGKVGYHIIEQGKPLDRMFIILEGQAEVWINGKRFATLSGQTLVGEVEFLDGLPASAEVVLVKETDLIELNNSALTSLMEKHPRLGFVLMREIAKIEGRRLRDTNPK